LGTPVAGAEEAVGALPIIGAGDALEIVLDGAERKGGFGAAGILGVVTRVTCATMPVDALTDGRVENGALEIDVTGFARIVSADRGRPLVIAAGVVEWVTFDASSQDALAFRPRYISTFVII